MTFRWGFKAEANWYASDLRREMGLFPHAPLDMRALANFLDIPLVKLSDFADTHPTEFDALKGQTFGSHFSGATFSIGGQGRAILYNDRHSEKRQASDIAHELAHCLLSHPLVSLRDIDRKVSMEHEEEANWLGPALLVSEEAALRIVRTGMTQAQASGYYGATEQVIKMRLNVTGALLRAKPRAEAAE